MVTKLIIIAPVLFFLGCATLYNPATGKKELIFINSQTEIAIGKGVVNEITKKQIVLEKGDLYNRVNSIGKRIALVSDRQDIEYKFFALADKELNAVSLPGGFIYVNKGLLDKLNNDELAFVLGHEIGHLAARHAIKKIQSNMTYQLLLNLAFAGIGAKSANNAPEITEGVNTVYNLIELGYNRADEYEADRLGVKYAFRAGFGANAALSGLEKLKKEEAAGIGAPLYLRTHPYLDDRISALKKAIPELTGNSNN